MKVITPNKIELAYDQQGRGKPLIFIAGMNRQLICWSEQFIEAFKVAGFETVRFDNRDVGLSSKTPTLPPRRLSVVLAAIARRQIPCAYDLGDMAHDTIALMDHLGYESAHIVGFSMGSMIAQEIVLQHPERVRSLCLIATNSGDKVRGNAHPRVVQNLIREPSLDREQTLMRALEFYRLTEGPYYDENENRAVLEARMARDFNPYATSHHIAAIAASRNRYKLLRQIKVPTLLIHGLQDPLITIKGGTSVAKQIEDARLLAFSMMGHSLSPPFWAEAQEAIIANANRAETQI